MYVIVGRLPGTPWVKGDVTVGFFAGLVPMLLLVRTVLRASARTRVLTVLFAGALVVALAFSWAGWLGLAAPFKVVAAVSLGVLLGLQLDAAWLLVLVAALALAADIWSVFAGPTRVIVERAPGFLDYPLVHFAALGTGGPGVALGMSDLVFLGLFTAGSALNGLRVRTTFVATTLSLVVTFAFTLITERALPALPLLGIALVVANVDLLGRRLRSWLRERRD